jgi:hypothetical protein
MQTMHLVTQPRQSALLFATSVAALCVCILNSEFPDSVYVALNANAAIAPALPSTVTFVVCVPSFSCHASIV